MKTTREKARGLIELAMDKGTSEGERVSAATAAVALIHKHDLLAHPLDKLVPGDNEGVKAAVDVFGRLFDPEFVGSVKKVYRGAKEAGRARRSSRRR
jgi:hypothetical protein